MAELNEQQAQDLNSGKAHRSRSGFWFGVIILLIVVGLAGVGYYFLQGLRTKQEGLGGEVKGEIAKQLQDYQAQLAAIQSQLANINKEMSSKDERFNKTLDSFSTLHKDQLNATRKELTDSMDKINRQLGKTRGDWLISDAEYLLSVANERLYLIGDVKTALEALDGADQRLKESGDSGVIKVREKIAEEITTIKGLTPPDTVGTYVAIQALQEQVDKLALLRPYADKPISDKKDNTDNAMLDVLGVKYSEQPIEAILTAEEAKFMYEQLRVKLEIAEIALVQQHDELYQSALDDAKNWLEKHFADNEAKQKFKDALDKFKAIKIRSQFPDISVSLKMLKDISKLRIEADKVAEEPKKEDVKKDTKLDNKPTSVAPETPAKP